MNMKTITASAGRPYGHVPGHRYVDVHVAVEAKGRVAKLTITWGSAQGYDEEHGREEYARRGADPASAIEAVRDAALDAQTDTDEETRALIETAAARAALEAEAEREAESARG